MGFKYGKDVLYSVTGLRYLDVADICKMLARKKNMPTPTLDVDCSNVCYKVSGRNAQSVANFLVKWAGHGLLMNPVCDGRVRPISKQATNERRAKREKHRINAHSLRLEIHSLNRKLKFDGMTDSERNDIREDIAKKQTAMKSKETQSWNVIQTNFEEKLADELESTGAHARIPGGGSVLPVMTAEFQADAVMMGRAASGEALMALTDDADIPIIAGDGCTAVKGYMKDGSLELVSTSRATLESMLELLSEAQKDLPEEKKSHPTLIPAAYPLFEGVSDRKLRALIALFLGCDVYVKGMANVGAKTMDEIINVKYPKFKERCPHASLFAYLKKYLYTYTEGFDNDVVHTYIRSLAYEPTNVAPEDGDDPSRTYLDDTPPSKLPQSLPSMFVDFAAQSRLDDGYRLLKRCIRHSFDSRCKSMDTGVGSLVFNEDGDVGVRLGFDVPASMRKNIYSTEIVATANKLLGCKCTCQCGSQDEERIVCVHTLVVLYLLSMLIMEDLAESMLIALASRITASTDTAQESGAGADEDLQWMWSMGNWTESEISEMKDCILTLMEAAGEVLPERDSNAKTIPELLQAFVVGTERRKEWKQKSKVPPKPSELGPVEDMHFMSTAQRAKLTMRPSCPETDSNAPPPTDSGSPSPPDEYRCSLPNCAYTQNDHSQEMKECCSALCSRLVHPLCQQIYEQRQALIPEENRWWCCECHPKKPKPPDYLKIVSLMRASGCDMDDSNIVGHRLLAMRAVNDMGADFSKLNAATKDAEGTWATLKKMAKKRSTNMAQPSRDNLKKRPHANISVTPSVDTPRRTAGQRAVTPSPAQRQPGPHRHRQLLPTRARAPAPEPKKGPLRRRKRYRKCHMWEGRCPVNSKTHPCMTFHKVTTYPAELKSANPRRDAVIRRYGKILLRQETLRRMGYPANDKRQYLVCENHQFERTVKQIQIKYNDEEPFERSFLLTVPVACGPKSSLIQSTSSKGTGRDRAVARIVNDMKETIEDGYVPPDLAVAEMESELESEASKASTVKEALHHTQEQLLLSQIERDRLKAELASEKLARSQDWEQNSEEAHIAINPALKDAAGLTSELSYPDSASGRFFNGRLQPLQDEKRPHSHDKDPPVISLNMPDDQVKRRTGFPSMGHLLAYVFIVCNGDLAKVTERRTVLTWLEAWFMHQEYKWGRTHARLPDVCDSYGPNHAYLMREINLKYSIEIRAREMWPTYVSYEEDIALRDNDKWGRKYDGLRIVMWDMTNIPAYGFSDADYNRMTYSKYYNQNCFKGGVGNQLCGWIVTAPLWTGAVSDTMYNERAGYLQEQMEFQQVDLVNGRVIPWTNVYDKGYRAKMVAFRMGEQLVLQPVWAESDRRFGRDETLLTAAVAHDRGANERAVNVCKRSWFVRRGFRPNSSAKQLNDAWMTWSFQCNFMFRPVL